MATLQKHFALLLVTASMLVGCYGQGTTEPLATERAAESAFPDSGFVPYPILFNPETFQPVLGNTGQYLPGWDGSIADLIAADAYALCLRTSHYRILGVFGNSSPPGNDRYLQYLSAKMGEVGCTSNDQNFQERWWYHRTLDNRCNLDPRSGELSTIDDLQRDSRGYDTLYGDFSNLDDWGLVGDATPFGEMETARLNAATEIEYADLNLCIAQYMREQANSGQSLFTASEDLTEILGVIRERAQLSSLYYGLLAKIASYESSGSEPSTIVSAENDWMVLARRWLRDIATEDELTRIGEDFGTAVRLMIQSTRDLASVLQRSAGQRPIGESGVSRSERDWGAGQPRIRLMNLLYGGDPIGQPNFQFERGRGFGGVAWYGGPPPFVSADMRDPRIATFLGLVRAADVMNIRLNVGGTGSAAFDVPASAERLYREVEVHLRVATCEIRDPGGDCDPEDIRAALPDIELFAEYDLWRKHLVQPRTAELLVQAFAQAFGELNTPVFFHEAGKFDGLMHLTGEHELVTIDGEQWIHFGADFGTHPFSGNELGQDYARLFYLPERMVLDANPYDQGFAVHGQNFGQWSNLRELGAVPALAFLREAIVEGSNAGGSRQALFAAVAPVLPDIDREVGKRSVIIRPELENFILPCPGLSSEPCEYLTASFGTDGYLYRVSSTTLGDDPLNELVVAQRSPQLHTVAYDASSVAFDGLTRADLDDYDAVSHDTETFSGFAAAYEKRVFAYEIPDGTLERLLLKGLNPGSETMENAYMLLGGNVFFPHQSGQESFGGELNALGDRNMRTLAADWSRPAFDAFGLPADWVPPADASLVGGNPGEQSYVYYLRVARQAAEEATAAVQVAIDNLILETQEQVDLDAAEQRAETIADIERASICGESTRCTDVLTVGNVWLGVRGDCTENDLGDALSTRAQAFCNAAMVARDGIIPLMRVTDVAYAAFLSGAPTFTDYAGSEVQGVLVRQWNAMRALAVIDDAFTSQARALGIEIAASEVARDATRAECDAADAELAAELAALDANDANIAGQLAALAAEESEYFAAYNFAFNTMEWECSENAMDNAREAGMSYSDVEYLFVDDEGWVTSIGWDNGSKTWSVGPMYAQFKLCEDAELEFNRVNASLEPMKASIQARRDALLALGALTEPQRTALLAGNAAAHAKCDAANASVAATNQTRWAQVVGSLSEMQAAVGEVLASQAAFNQLAQRLEGVSAQEALEKDLAQKQADSRFGIQRKFRSYDMWRARALLESARRLAVAARRAVESHFVVDLSDLNATQAFVESPALWADEIYGSDLDAPSVVGLSAAPKIEGAIFPNKLIDYVENLERFVQGYTISYPTSLAEPDTELLSLPGPDVRDPLVEVGDEAQMVSRDSIGWTFYCPDEQAWLSNPGVGEFPLETTVDTLCAGEQPTRARYGFSLDPWGRLGGAIAIAPLEQRHNVRWRRLAVNLVGTGIRDCEAAIDPLTCYAEPFLRYDLKHVGPAWTTNYAQEWRGFNLPTALIEDAKALATEEWLDPLTNSWNTPLVSNAARAELFGRSIGGSYQLEIEFGPEVRLSRIERVQLLAQSDYWVRQE